MATKNECTCENEDIEPHRCPYSDDVYDQYELDDSEVILCTCCDYCAHRCAMDI